MYNALINARSIKINVDIILAYISKNNPSIIACTDTCLSSNDIYTITLLYNFSTKLHLHNYSFIRSDRVYGRGDGIGIMIHNYFRIISSNCLVFSYSAGLSKIFKRYIFKLLLYIVYLLMIL